ncbi:hypothetical protein BO99DRAFT_431708 [Aspergillus violaceofuscus CBS 115571]|uniref:Uncharacterized protein n=1 Tax=Aspergillus violaceofuscus (strain CBS 115571) TaxID=1450538 RepID=A0A2V5I866_ASPV1|nr:hypothetical protein BO99DRAFT_431708 [Aspergillus violaceofuscus CBS 115571]
MFKLVLSEEMVSRVHLNRNEQGISRTQPLGLGEYFGNPAPGLFSPGTIMHQTDNQSPPLMSFDHAEYTDITEASPCVEVGDVRDKVPLSTIRPGGLYLSDRRTATTLDGIPEAQQGVCKRRKLGGIRKANTVSQLAVRTALQASQNPTHKHHCNFINGP